MLHHVHNPDRLEQQGSARALWKLNGDICSVDWKSRRAMLGPASKPCLLIICRDGANNSLYETPRVKSHFPPRRSLAGAR